MNIMKTISESWISAFEYSNTMKRVEIAYTTNSMKKLKEFAQDDDLVIRYWVLKNSNATEEICLMAKSYDKFYYLIEK